MPIEMLYRPQAIKANAEDQLLVVPSLIDLQWHYHGYPLPVVIFAGTEDQTPDPTRHAIPLSAQRPLRNRQAAISLAASSRPTDKLRPACIWRPTEMSGRAQRPGATTEQLRDDIDSGRTADKVPANDPAAAPLGTDEEAAGTPLDPRLVAQVRAAESSRRPAHDRDGKGKNSTGWIAALVVILMLSVAAGVLLWG